MFTRMPLLLETLQRPPKVRWRRPDVDEEHDEIVIRAKELGIHPDALKQAIQKGIKGPLSHKHWKRLQNTDSWDTKKISRARELSIEYDKDVDRVEHGMRKGHTLPAAMVLHRKGKPPYLVGGNTRLMVARALGVKPHVIHARLS